MVYGSVGANDAEEFVVVCDEISRVQEIVSVNLF